jgi:PD-(D/E)XK nuclease superfamily
VIYSYTQIAQYLRCPRSYRYRYLDGWMEKETKGSLIFGRCFEKALAAYFRKEDCAAALYQEWGAYRDAALEFGKADSWDKLLHQGVHLLHMFAQDNRVRVLQPSKNLQLKMLRALPNGGEFVAYIDAIGEIDGQRFLIDWKTTTSRYAEEPDGLLSLDPQLISYSWISGIPDVALVVFVRKRFPEIQYLKASITDEQREEVGRLVPATASQIETGQFPAHSGIRFPMNGCTSCAHLGLCLGSQSLIDSKLIRRPGAADLDWLDRFEE